MFNTWGPIYKSNTYRPIRKPAKIDQAKAIQIMLNQKMSAPDIAEALGITRNAVHKCVQAYGLKYPQ